jgi:plastocyanin
MRTLVCLTKFVYRTMFVAALATVAFAQSGSDSSDRKVIALDNCDPKDPGWLPVGCFLRDKKDNNVTFAQFEDLLASPLSLAVIGHPSWRFEPGYLTVETGKSLRLLNEGGRPHTFTPVAEFGGGRVPPNNVPGLFTAPECAAPPAGAVDPYLVPAGGSLVKTLPQGEHKIQCCLHPWMRMIVKVEAKK